MPVFSNYGKHFASPAIYKCLHRPLSGFIEMIVLRHLSIFSCCLVIFEAYLL